MYNRYRLYLSVTSTSKLRILQDPRTDQIDFSTNDYLKFSQSKELLNAATKAGNTYGIGATGSRLLSGNQDLFKDLERKIAQDKNADKALIFNSGFQANVSVLDSLLDKKILGAKPLVFFDKLNHSSLYQGVFLSGATLIRYNHNNMQNLEELLLKYQNHPSKKFIVSETVFGMSGDIAPMQDLIDLSERFNAFLYLDEAHATGIFGKHGYGLSTDYDLTKIENIVMGTFSKAIGCAGAYVACSDIIYDYLINKSHGFIYSTAPSPMVIGAASAAWDKIKHLDKERSKLLEKAKFLREAIKNIGFNTWNSETHIIPIVLKDDGSVLEAKEKLRENNIELSAIRPPTVPIGKSCLRVALTTSHTDAEIEKLINALETI